MNFTAHGLKVGPDVVAQHTVPLAGARKGRAVCAARQGDKRQRFSFKGGRGRGGEAGRAVRETPVAPRARPGLAQSDSPTTAESSKSPRDSRTIPFFYARRALPIKLAGCRQRTRVIVRAPRREPAPYAVGPRCAFVCEQAKGLKKLRVGGQLLTPPPAITGRGKMAQVHTSWAGGA